VRSSYPLDFDVLYGVGKAINKSLKASVEALFDVVSDRSTREELCIICPQPGCGDKSGNRSINLINGKTNCWRCGKSGPKGSFILWAKNLGYPIDEDTVVVEEDTSLEEALSVLESETRTTPVYSVDIQLPHGFTLLEKKPNSIYTEMIAEMAIRKNLTLKDFIRAGAGFTSKDPYWEPFAIFPVKEWGRVTYYQGRLYDRDEEKKRGSTKQFPSKKVCPFGSRHWVYNIDTARQLKSDVIIIVESILNVLSLERKFRQEKIIGVTPVAIFKHKISPEQLIKLSALKYAKEFCLMFDSDATLAAWTTVQKQYRIPYENFTIAEMPEGIDANDDADMAFEKFIARKVYSARSGMLNELSHLASNL